MIRRDIMDKLKDSDLNSLFMEHRAIDQSTYRVGEINGEIVCWNPSNGYIMDYFYDDIQDEWFNIKLVYPNINTKHSFEINRNGVLRKVSEFNTTIKNVLFSNEYPSYVLATDSSGRTTLRPSVHRLLAIIFIPRLSEDKDCVDHIDRNKYNYALSNLRWVTVTENNNNKRMAVFTSNLRFEAYYDRGLTQLDRIYSNEDIYNHPTLRKRGIRDKTTEGVKYHGRYWKIVNIDIENYLKSGETIDDSLWKLHFSGKFEVHPLGLVRNLKTKNIISLGALDSNGKYRSFNGYSVHRAVAEVFLNDNKPIDKNLHVDHLDTNRQNNRVTNLKICTRTENMNNPLTRQAMATKVIAEGVIYNSITECAKHYGLTRQAITFRLNSKYQTDFNYYNED